MGPGRAVFLDERFDMPDDLRGKKRVGTYIANFRGNAIKNQNVSAMLDRMHDGSRYVFSRTAMNAAFHRCVPRSKGVGHFGGCGS